MKTILTAALLGAFAVAAFAADVTGKWMAQVPGRNGNQDVTFNLNQSGSSLTGTVTTPNGDQQISEGKVDGNDLSFVVSFEARGNTIRQEYKGTVAGSEIKFTRSGGRGNPIEFTAKKQ
ncbi:MAG: hypothetical protein JO336_07485 [Acidobacteriia bacterium]|nr:hypothetical protein [Terriglobia bacterium]MBV8902094.1 hypothetical protein [Terriglobia bacterium]MBV9746934.1 hypothetical protein [Terriglobia bacterium]